MSHRKALWLTIKGEKSCQLQALRKVSHSTYKKPLRGGLRKEKKKAKTLVGSGNSIGGVKME